MLNPWLRTTLYALAIPFAFPLLAAAPGGWFTAVLGIGFLIFIHEWGHYMACVLTGTRTETFSVGFGPRLLGWERDRDGKRRFTLGRRQLDPDDHTMDFRVALIPLGGYVKMAGGEIIGESQSTDPDMFVNKSAWARIFIVSAGVIMNVITAAIFYSLSFASGKQEEPNVIGDVVAGGPAWAAELEPGDRVVAINGSPIKSFYDLRIEVVFSDDDEYATFTIERDGKRRDVKVRPSYLEDRGSVGIEVLPGAEITIGEGADALTIGFTDDAVVAGIPVRGGFEALQQIDTAIEADRQEFVVEHGGRSVRIDTRTLDREAEPSANPGAKVGLEPFVRGIVKATRGDTTKDDIATGDVVMAAKTPGGERIELTTAGAYLRLPYAAPVTALVVKRGDEEREVPVDLSTGADVEAWLKSHALEMKPSNRVVPIRAGRQHVLASHLFRYPSSPATEAGVAPGDRIVRIGSDEIDTFTDVVAAISEAEIGKPIEAELEAEDGSRRIVTMAPVELEHLGKLDIEQTTRLPLDVGLGEAFVMGTKNTGREIANVFRTIGALFTGKLAFEKNIAGPARLVQFSKSQADRGVPELLWFLAYVSVMLAVLNVLPIPVLDGGHLLFIIIEKVKGSPLKEATVAKAMYFGLFIVLTLMFFAFKADFKHFF